MTNYYEILNVSPTASTSDIEQALDAQYNQVRRLITHHDPNIVNQANRDLQVLEKIRSILTDVGKRSAYDAAILPQFGGLVDPQIQPSSPNSQPSLFVGSPQPAVSASPSQPVGPIPSQRGWTCPKCQSINAVNSQFCKSCGETLAAPCPACKHLAERNAEFCTNCGVNILRAAEKNKLDAQLIRARVELEVTTKNVPVLDKNVTAMNKLTVLGAVWAVVSLMAALTFLLASTGELTGIDLSGPIQSFLNGSRVRQIPMENSIALVASVALLIAAPVLVGILRKTSPLPGLGAILVGILFMTGPRTTGNLLVSSGTLGAVVALLLIVYFFALSFRKMRSIFKNYFACLKPHYPRLPKVGFLGTLFFWILSATPLFYTLFIFMIVGRSGNEFSTAVDRYQSYVLKINGVQLLILALLLGVYALMGIRTAQAAEIRLRQEVLERSEKMEKLTRQLQSLEQAIGQIDLHSR